MGPKGKHSDKQSETNCTRPPSLHTVCETTIKLKSKRHRPGVGTNAYTRYAILVLHPYSHGVISWSSDRQTYLISSSPTNKAQTRHEEETLTVVPR